VHAAVTRCPGEDGAVDHTANHRLSIGEHLELEPTGDDEFVGRETGSNRHLFGGLLIAQALRAATLTVGARPARSIHSSFLVAGNGTQPVRYEVERTRDGRSFSTRRVVARQESDILLVATVDFHDSEDGPEYSPPISDGVPGPDGLPPGRYDSPLIESRDVPVSAASGGPPIRRAWFRPTLPLAPDLSLHQQVLAFLSDSGATRAVREPHAAHPDIERRMSISLDHSVWFLRAAAVDQWLLSELWPMSTGAGRGLAIGTIRTSDGTLLATVAQEALLRLPS
jgi:acyl-CoA thioesterase-2